MLLQVLCADVWYGVCNMGMMNWTHLDGMSVLYGIAPHESTAIAWMLEVHLFQVNIM